MTRNTFNLEYANPMLNPPLYRYHSFPLGYLANKLVTLLRECLQGIDSFQAAMSYVASYAYVEYCDSIPEGGTHQSYDWFIKNMFIPAVSEMFDLKGAEYVPANEDDRLRNFKMVSEESEEITPLQAWYVYTMKHIISLKLFVTNRVQKSEPIFNRCVDVAAYMVLGKALRSESV
jgi:hypothetical protein